MNDFSFDDILIDIKCELLRTALKKYGIRYNHESGKIKYNCGKNRKTAYINKYTKVSYNVKNNTITIESDLFDDDLKSMLHIINDAILNNCKYYNYESEC